MELAVSYESEVTDNSARQIGERALWHAGYFIAELGVNDPVTHLEQYLEGGEIAMASIDEDLISDCAERMENAVFENQVWFHHEGNDFVSHQNHFSMREMTAITEDKFYGSENIADLKLYRRARIEAREVERLNQWFGTAQVNDAYIVESLGITPTEKYAIVRMHQKISETELVEHIITLHNATVDTFNQLHRLIGADVADSRDELELLDKMYAYHPVSDKSFNEFISKYVGSHDDILEKADPGQQFNHGLPREQKRHDDDIEAIRRQLALRQVYLNGIRNLGDSRGYVTPEIQTMETDLKLQLGLNVGEAISTSTARLLLDASLQSIMATLNRASRKELNFLATSDSTTAASVAGGYGAGARSEGVRYDGACPSGGPGSATAAEAAALANAYGHGANSEQLRVFLSNKCRSETCKGKLIFAWSKGSHVGCYNCGRREDICTGEVISRGRQQQKKSGPQGFFEVLIETHTAELQRQSLNSPDESRLSHAQKQAA